MELHYYFSKKLLDWKIFCYNNSGSGSMKDKINNPKENIKALEKNQKDFLKNLKRLLKEEM